METSANLIESLFERVEAYGRTTIQLSKLRAVETAATGVTSLISLLCVIMVVFLFSLVLNIGIALWLGEVLGKLYYGFFIVALFYLVVAIVLRFFLHQWIKKPVGDSILAQVLDYKIFKL